MITKELPKKCDALVIGSGGAGLTFALALKSFNPKLKVHIVERTSSAGGCTTYSGGGLWMPGHQWMYNPSKDTKSARTYVKKAYPAINNDCLDGFLEDAPNVMKLYASKNVLFEKSPDYPDYYQEISGASYGRCVFPLAYNGPKKIRSVIRKVPSYYVPLTLNELISCGHHRVLHWPKALLAKRYAMGFKVMGQAMIGFLLEACMNAGVDISFNSNVDELLIQNRAATGAVVNDKTISAPICMLANGGFSHHPELMKRIPTSRAVLSVAPEECDSGGGGLKLALAAGLKTGNPDCWWMPVFKEYNDQKDKKPGPDLWAYHFCIYDRSWPSSIMVNAEGKRFTNESACYNTVGGFLAKSEDPALDKVWLIWGKDYVKHYPRGTVMPQQMARSYMHKSKTIKELSAKTGLPAANLRDTINRWNDMAEAEKDTDFYRGQSTYDQYLGDQFKKGHPNIGPVTPPFQAVRLHAGTLGVKMGAVTDPHGRILAENNSIISGLYGAGNATASFFGKIYPGAGATLGQATVFAYRAAKHAGGKYMK